MEKRTEKIHGATTLTYPSALVVVPPFVRVVPNCDTPKVHVSCSNGLLKSATAVVQLLFACLTLYRTKGDQVELYGYAAFGLTVLPYAIMSILNLTANLLTPEYPTLFMVQSDVMHDDQHGPYEFEFDGTVGIIKNATTNSNGSYDTISVREIFANPTDMGYQNPTAATLRGTAAQYQAKIHVPQNYVEIRLMGNSKC